MRRSIIYLFSGTAVFSKLTHLIIILTIFLEIKAMRKLIHVVLVFGIIVFIASGCYPIPMLPYNSTADIDHLTVAEASEFQFIYGDKTREKLREFGVFAARDNQEIYYLLIAPYIAPSAGPRATINRFQVYPINKAVMLQTPKVSELLIILDSVISTWTDSLPPDKAVSYQYLVTPEQKITKLSENVYEYNATFRFWYQRGIDKPICYWVLRNEYDHSFKSLEEVEDLYELLTMGMEELKKMGYVDAKPRPLN